MRLQFRSLSASKPSRLRALTKLCVLALIIAATGVSALIFTSPKRDCDPAYVMRIATDPIQAPLQCWMDGCSAVPDFNFGDCCDQHDVAYWHGGPRAKRLEADEALFACLSERGHGITAWAYFAGVRIFGVPWLPAQWRWGYGWPFSEGFRGYR